MVWASARCGIMQKFSTSRLIVGGISFSVPDACSLEGDTRTPRSNSHLLQSQHTLDVLVRNEGTVFLFNPLTSRAKEWMEKNVHPDAQWFGTTLVVEHRFAWALAQGMKDDGLVLA